MRKKPAPELERIKQFLSQVDQHLHTSEDKIVGMGQAFRYVLNETGQSNAVLVLKNFPTVFTVSPLPEWAGLVGKDVDRIFSNNSDISSVEGGKITVIKAVQGEPTCFLLLAETKMTKLQENLLHLGIEKIRAFAETSQLVEQRILEEQQVAVNNELIDTLARKWARFLSRTIHSDGYGVSHPTGLDKKVLIKKASNDDVEWAFQTITQQDAGLFARSTLNTTCSTVPDVASATDTDTVSDGLPGHTIHSVLFLPLIVEGQMHAQLALMRLDKNKIPFNQDDLLAAESLLPLLDESLTINREVEQLKQVNKSLQSLQRDLTKSRNLLRSLIDTLPESLYIIDTDYVITGINRARTKRIGSEPRKHVGKVCYQTLFKRQSICEGCLAHVSFASGKSTERKRSDETARSAVDWEINTYGIADEFEKVREVILVEHDITERNRIEQALLQSEKLAAVGQLAAGVAHEINNPLTAVLANSQLLKRELPPNAEWQEMLDLIYRGGSQALLSVKNLLNLSRDEEFKLTDVILDESLEKAFALVRHEIVARGITFKYEPADSPELVHASPTHLQSVWLNLLLNAIDALQGNERVLEVCVMPSADMVNIIFSDTGIGFDNRQRTKIFEPFYTTKDREMGTGLGLPISFKIIRQHGGTITASSKLGEGSKFTVSLPRVK